MNTMYWAGSEASADIVKTARTSIAAAISAGGANAARFFEQPTKDDFPPLVQFVGSTAIVNIEGPMVDGSAGWSRLWGVIGYDDIAEQVIPLVGNNDVQSILFHITSPGGQVAGVMDLGELFKKVSAVKPSAAHGSSMVASAGYWLMSSISGLKTAGPTAEIGSIGVLQVAIEYSKQLEEEGVTAKVLRSAPMKARMNPYEPLGEDAEAHALEQLGQMHDLFVKQVRAGRPNMTTEQLNTATDGRTFIGALAVKAGLVDRVANLDQALKLLDKNSGKKDTPSNSRGATMKLTLTDNQIDALLGGASLESLGFTAEQIAGHQAALRAENAAAVADAAGQAAAKATEDAAGAAAATAADVKPNPAQAPPEHAAVLAHVQGQLDAKASDLAKAQADLATANAKLASLNTEHTGLLAIAREATGKMLIPLGGSAADTAEMSAGAIITKYAETKTKFEATFVPGARAANAAATEQKAAEQEVPQVFKQLARQQAAKA